MTAAERMSVAEIMTAAEKAKRISRLTEAAETIAWFLYGTKIGAGHIKGRLFLRALSRRKERGETRW